MSDALDEFLKSLRDAGFVATGVKIEKTIVVHGVAGSGKSTLINQLINNSEFAIFNPIASELHRIDGRRIERELKPTEGKINVLDEYLRADNFDNFDILFGDPFQSTKIPLVAHYTKNFSHRFKKEILPILKSIGFEVEADKEGLEVVVDSGYTVAVEGKVIAIETEVINHLKAHNCEVFTPNCVQGLEFKVVSFYHSRDLESLDKTEVYIALTRALEKINILRI
ncbi:triple gene block protein 2 [Musa ornata-associated banmivirus]|uniref:triple gene block protein 2 n=1 Tax=Musa ornata-associated banmivirus TaxID=3071210 RepID=UPI002481E73B|nr:triple gene block protein 2 [Musa ornata-associated banmivirus]UIK24037.1 triple gene block protein 2 [Musa ornata-associated banmivirus]